MPTDPDPDRETVADCLRRAEAAAMVAQRLALARMEGTPEAYAAVSTAWSALACAKVTCAEHDRPEGHGWDETMDEGNATRYAREADAARP